MDTCVGFCDGRARDVSETTWEEGLFISEIADVQKRRPLNGLLNSIAITAERALSKS